MTELDYVDMVPPAEDALPDEGERPPVFVDPRGTRARVVGRIGVVATVAFFAYLLLLGASLVQAPWVPRVALPGLGQVLPNHRKLLPPGLGPTAVVTPTPSLKAVAPRASGAPTTVIPAKKVSPTTARSSATTVATTTTTLPGRGRGRGGTPTTTKRGKG